MLCWTASGPYWTMSEPYWTTSGLYWTTSGPYWTTSVPRIPAASWPASSHTMSNVPDL